MKGKKRKKKGQKRNVTFTPLPHLSHTLSLLLFSLFFLVHTLVGAVGLEIPTQQEMPFHKLTIKFSLWFALLHFTFLALNTVVTSPSDSFFHFFCFLKFSRRTHFLIKKNSWYCITHLNFSFVLHTHLDWNAKERIFMLLDILESARTGDLLFYRYWLLFSEWFFLVLLRILYCLWVFFDLISTILVCCFGSFALTVLAIYIYIYIFFKRKYIYYWNLCGALSFLGFRSYLSLMKTQLKQKQKSVVNLPAKVFFFVSYLLRRFLAGGYCIILFSC